MGYFFYYVCSWPFCSGVSVVSGVQVAARSLIQLFREKNPHLLHHKYRVKLRLLVKLTGYLQLPEISWNLKLLPEVLEISSNLVDAPGKCHD